MNAAPQSCQPSPEQMRQIAEYLSSREPDHDGDIVAMFTGDQRDAFVEVLSSHASLKAALESIASWRTVNLSGEYEHGLRDVIRSIVDCARAALEAKPAGGTGK